MSETMEMMVITTNINYMLHYYDRYIKGLHDHLDTRNTGNNHMKDNQGRMGSLLLKYTHLPFIAFFIPYKSKLLFGCKGFYII